MRTVGFTCSRIMLTPWVKSSSASTALRPFQGSKAAWAVRPWNSTIMSTSAWPLRMSARVRSAGCQARATSTSRKSPSRAM